MATGPTSPLTPLFVDTNLDTHLIMLVSPHDTASDLKGKIRTGHARCFPKIGEVSVEALKVQWGTSLYHLLDTLPLWSAFNGATGNWLLHVDLVPATSTVTNQTETARVITENGLLREQRNVLQTDRDSSLLLVNGEGDVSSRGIDGRPYADVPAMELCAGDDAAVASNHQEKGGQVSGQGNQERKGEDNGNVGTGADVEIPSVVSKKEKSRKRTSPLQNGQLDDGKSEHPYVGKKKRKKEKGQFSKEHVEDQLAEDNIETGFCSKEISQPEQHVEKSFQEKHVTNLVPSEVYSSKPSHVDSSLQQTHTDFKLKKKKKMHLSENEEAPQDDQVRNQFGKTDAASGKHDEQKNSGEGLVNNHGNLRKESDAADLVEGSAKKVLDGNYPEEGSTMQQIHGTVTRDQVPEENQNTISCPKDKVPEENQTISHHQHPDKEFKSSHVPVPDAAAGNSGLVTSTVPASPNDRKKKRSHKKSEKIELQHHELNLQSTTHEPVKPSREQVTKEFSKEQASMHLEHTGKEHKEASIATCLLNPIDKKSKRSRKKLGKSELHGQEVSKDEVINSLVQESTKENSAATLNGSTGGIGENSNPETIIRETAENATVDNSVESGKTGEETDTVTVQDKTHKGYVESVEARDHRQLVESDGGKIDFIKFFSPKENQPEPLKELSSVETERKKSNKEKSKRKKKLNPSPLDSGLPKPAVSQEQYILKKKSHDNDSGKLGLGDTAVHIAEELKSRKKHGKKDANGTHNPDLHRHDIDLGIGSPRRPHDDDKPGKKAKDRESNAHVQVSISVDEENKHPSRSNSMTTGIQSRTHDADNNIMDSSSQVPKHKDFDASVSNSPGGGRATQNSSNTIANVTVEEGTSGLVASIDSSEEETPVVRKRYRIAVRKVPHGKVQNKLNEEKISLAPSATIFDNAGGSSDDEFEPSNRRTPTKAISNNSSTSFDSDGDLEETQTSYKKNSGAESLDYGKRDKGTIDARNVLAQSSNMKRRGKPLSTILKSTSSYKKAKLITSQSEFEDSESHDVIPETQPELAYL